jgi:PPK2 family polyphosphate:nucleotide phosphotransferase
MKIEDAIRPLMVEPGSKIDLEKDYDPAYTADYLKKADAGKILAEGVKALAKLQDKLYAQNDYALLIIFQALDAAGKDGAIKHVMSGLNPQGVQVTSFKTPSAEELSHDFLWRCAKVLPERGKVGIFNRSYYEEALVVRVHPEFLKAQRIPPALLDKGIWQQRYRSINHFERHLNDNGIIVLKFFLNLSKSEQKKRFLARIDDPDKNWKYSPADIKERGYWDDYRTAYEDLFNHTSTEWAPWYIIPADHKWFSRLAIAAVIYTKLNELHLRYPQVDAARRQEIEKTRALLEPLRSAQGQLSVEEAAGPAEFEEGEALPPPSLQEPGELASPTEEEAIPEALVAEIT